MIGGPNSTERGANSAAVLREFLAVSRCDLLRGYSSGGRCTFSIAYLGLLTYGEIDLGFKEFIH